MLARGQSFTREKWGTVDIRTRRPVCLAAAALAFCVLAPSLALMTAAPARAANSAGELLVDPSDRSTPLTDGGVRPFGGSDRYETAVRLAERYAHELGGLDSVSTVILVSGETPISGATVAGLSALEHAPVLLTRPTDLPGHVVDFIEDHRVTNVIVVGGTDSVSPSVLDELSELDSNLKTRRITGDDRYATAAAVASELDGLTNWCGTNDTVALLASGDTDHLGYVAATGPLAYSLEIPVLLTRRDTLPRSTAEALEHLRIDRVVMVGSTSVVSDDLISQLLAAGVDKTERIVASTPETAAAAVARLMIGKCDFELNTARYIVGLVGRDSAVDAVAAGPLLGAGLDGSGPVPLLFVRSPLASTASSFLRTTRTTVDGRKTHTELVAIGGPAAISDAVMNLAVRTATTSRTLTARISATDGENQFRIRFSEGLVAEVAKLQARMRDLLYVNDSPAWIISQELTGPVAAGVCETLSNLTVTLRDPLHAGDTIEMRTTDGWFATNGDQRPLQRATYTVPTPRAPAPTVSMDIIAIAGHSDLMFAIEYDPQEHLGSGEPGGISVNPSRVRILTDRDVEVAVGEPVFHRAERFLGLAFYRMPLTAPEGYPGDSGSEPIPLGAAYELANNDLVDLRGGAVGGPDGLRSGRQRARVSTSGAAFGVSTVRIGPDNPGVDDSATTTTPDKIEDVSVRAMVTLGEAIRIVGKWSGSADGAAGNGWEIDSARASASLAGTASAISRTNHPAVRVWVNIRDRVVLLRFINSEDGEAPKLTHGELVGALSGNSAFSRQFLAELLDGCGGEDEPLSLDENSPFLGMSELDGGLSSVSFLVSFTDYVREFASDTGFAPVVSQNGVAVVGLIDDILGALIPDYAEDPPATPDRVETTSVLPYDKVLFRFTTADSGHTIGQAINFRRIRIEIAAGIARGYGPDDPVTVDVDENENPAKTLRGVSSRDALLRVGHPAAAS